MKQQGTLIRSAKVILLVITLYTIAASLSSQSEAQQLAVEYRKGEVLIEIKPDSSIDALNARWGTASIQRIQGTNIYRLATPNSKKENKWRKRLKNDPDVLTASLNPVMVHTANTLRRSTPTFPNSNPSAGQSRQNYVSQQLVEDLGALHVLSRGAGVVVAVIDTGIAPFHPDISSHIWTNPLEIPADHIDNDSDGFTDDTSGWDFLDGDNDPSELRSDSQPSVSGHGTFVTGLIALVAPEARILPIRAFDSAGLSDAFTVAAAIKYAADRGARVINLSFGSPEESQLVRDAVVYARQRGALLVAAAGNDNKDSDSAAEFPAGFNQDVLTVAAIDSTGRKADFSNYGSGVSVSAPGVRLYSAYPQVNNIPDYAVWSGTGFAAALAAAEAALILEDNPKTDDLRGTIERTATSIDDNNPNFRGKLGKGRINPLAALNSFDTVAGNSSEIRLVATSVEPSAEGKAEVKITATEQEFEIEAERLRPRAVYKIVVDGSVILNGAVNARAVASNFGSFKIEFSTSPSGDDLPLPTTLNPVSNIRRVEVRDEQDRIVLAGSFGAGNPGGGEVEKTYTLIATGVDANAEGEVKIKSSSALEELEIFLDDLNSFDPYYIIVIDGSLFASITSDGQGRFLMKWSTQPDESSTRLPQEVRPLTNIRRIEVLDGPRRVILSAILRP